MKVSWSRYCPLLPFFFWYQSHVKRSLGSAVPIGDLVLEAFSKLTKPRCVSAPELAARLSMLGLVVRDACPSRGEVCPAGFRAADRAVCF